LFIVDHDPFAFVAKTFLSNYDLEQKQQLGMINGASINFPPFLLVLPLPEKLFRQRQLKEIYKSFNYSSSGLFFSPTRITNR
jgi:hypothetical protein